MHSENAYPALGKNYDELVATDSWRNRRAEVASPVCLQLQLVSSASLRKTVVWANSIGHLVFNCQRFCGTHARNVTLHHRYFLRALRTSVCKE